ncbi:hypothetical protein LOTGIDRAFT_205589 [Lottia gigantea]|uniref:Multifunctional methyltransferase subunit TRM112-like protein n=1 Tax=Lottia gigantea TaxID=225164 RepID=V4BI93_LOTGI|nr:hypothetical protein LOTGIDRAFT_205589 [Lottia gigantea]ESP05672.1 hypothetical protein LOTGIDRAFT_205589 [Lottia gigantea]
MKLLTHNMLTSNIIKGVKNGYPLKIAATKVEEREVDYNPEFITRLLPKLDWSAVHKGAVDLNKAEGVPESMMDDYESNEDFLKTAHNILLQVEIIEGNLECPETGRKFPITNGIPNMLLNEDEVSEK